MTTALRNTLIIIVTFVLAPFARLPTVSAAARVRQACKSFILPNKRKGVEIKYAGKTYEEWGNYRLLWLSAFNVSADPDKDATGQYAYQNQPDGLFLLGFSRDGKSYDRYITVPKGIPLFFPTFSVYAGYFYGTPFPDIRTSFDPPFLINLLTSVGVNVTLDITSEEWFSLYGKAFCENLLINLTLRVDNCNIDPFQEGLIWTKASHVPFVVPAEPYWDVDDRNWANAQCGYYHMLAPLKPGNHTISFTGDVHNNSQQFFWDSLGPYGLSYYEVKYHITVV